MASISEKLVTVAENTPKVHHAGQLNVVQSAQSLKGSESNTAMLIDDVSPVTHEMGVKVRGKNLIPYPYRDTTKTENGITFTDNGDGSITANGTATTQSYFYLFRYKTIKAGTYALSGCPSGGGSSTYKILGIITASDGTRSYLGDYGNSATTTFTEDVTIDLRIQIETEQIVENFVFKPQLEYGSTPTAYTKYIPDLTVVTVSRYGKNLFDVSSSRGFESTLGGIISTINGNTLEVVCTVTAHIGFLELGTFPKGTYTFSYSESYDFSQTIMTGSDIPNLKALGSSFTTNTKTFTLSKESKVWVRNSGFNSGASPFTFTNIQLELNSTATDYEPYNSKTDYTPNTDGTVDGVTSLYPNTTLTTDTDGVIIDCEYYKDIDKAFNELSSAIALSGGE